MPRAPSAPTAAPLVPERRSLRALREAAAGCTACPLYEDATQTVFGSGPAKARIMLVGEQPGDREDREGEPFVGPTGPVLAEALAGAEIERSEVHLTNAVKHFKWKPRSSLLRLRDAEERALARAELERDLATAAAWLKR